MAELKHNPRNSAAFKQLSETSLVLTILLNRKRVGDVQYMQLESYTQTEESTCQEECLTSLSEAEKVLCKHFKRIVTIGKGSRSVPILFPKNVQKYLETLLSARKTNGLIFQENPFLFASTTGKKKSVDRWIVCPEKIRKKLWCREPAKPNIISAEKTNCYRPSSPKSQ